MSTHPSPTSHPIFLPILAAVGALVLAGQVRGDLIVDTSQSPFTSGVANQGWWSPTYANQDANENYAAGYSNDLRGVDFRNFFTFDLRAVDLEGLTVVGATLQLSRYQYLSSDPSETIEFFDVSTPAATLNYNAGISPAIYADLGSGISYGSFAVSRSGAETDTLSFSLNSAALEDIMDAAGNSYFSLGGAVTSVRRVDENELLFGFSFPDCSGVQRLVINTELTAVPEPGTGLWAIGLMLSLTLRPSHRRLFQKLPS